MRTFQLILIVTLSLAVNVPFVDARDFYKCQTDEGITFSPQPCGDNSQKVRSRGQSGGVDYLEDDKQLGGSEAKAHDGPVLKTLGGQVRDNKQWLYGTVLQKKSPQRHCGEYIDKNGMIVFIPCNE